MADTRAKGIVAASFVGGVLVAVAIYAPRAWEPVPEPFFGLEEPAQVATPLPRQSAASPPAKATQATPVGDLASLAAAMPAVVKPGPPPERLALVPSASSSASVRSVEGIVAEAAVSRRGSAAETRDAVDPAPHDTPLPAPEPLAVPPVPPDSLKSLVNRVQMGKLVAKEPAPGSHPGRAATPSAPRVAPQPSRIGPSQSAESLGAAPLPGAAWTDPDSVNWTDAAAESASSPPGRADAAGQGNAGGRILERFRGGDRLIGRGRRDEHQDDERSASLADVPDVRRPGTTWPHPAKLLGELQHVSQTPAHDAVVAWSRAALASLGEVLATSGPRDAAVAAALIRLGESVHAGMEVADRVSEAGMSSRTRRAALALSRRVAIWRAAAGMFAPPSSAVAVGEQPIAAAPEPLLAARAEADVARLLDTLERYEASLTITDASELKEAVRTIEALPLSGGVAIVRAVADHYLSPNVRIAVHQPFVEKLMPEQQVTTGPLNDVINGRPVRGTRTVTRTTRVQFVPDHDEVAINLEIHGDIASRSVTDAGLVELTSRGSSSFVVRKPMKVSLHGLLFGPATGTASNSSQLAGIQTSFDSVPVMRSFVRQLARSQHDDALPDVNREVINKIVAQACRETDQQAEPRFVEVAERVRTRLWMPLVKLGLEPTPVVLETTPAVATVRLRLAAETQVAAHTPRPRAPADAQFSMQLHESAVNNAVERLGLAGERFKLEELARHVCERIGIEPRVPDDLPEGVEVAFARTEPIRVTCDEGLVQVRVALEAIESGRRHWYDVVAQVAYRPVVAGPQVFLERDGPVRISGPGHQGRMEIALRAIFGKIFPKERPIAVVPERIVAHPRLEGMRAVQAVTSDGWFAFALAAPEAAATVATQPVEEGRDAKRPAVFR